MTTPHAAALRRSLGLLVLTLLTPACAATGHHTLVRTAPGDEMAFDRMPTSVERPTSIAMPALAPCHLAGHGPDIVCPLVNMDATYYAAMRRRGEADTTTVADSADETHHASDARIASDE